MGASGAAACLLGRFPRPQRNDYDLCARRAPALLQSRCSALESCRLLAPHTHTAMARLAATTYLIYFAVLSLSSPGQAQASPPTPREVFSAPHAFQFFAFGLPECDALFSLSAPSVAYTPPAAGVPASLAVPTSAFAINDTACDAVTGAEFALADIGVDGNPFLKVLAPAGTLLYVYGPQMSTAVGVPQCAQGGALKMPMQIENFVFFEASKAFQTVTPDPREGTLSVKEGVIYAVFYFFVGEGEGRKGSVSCLMRDVKSRVSTASNIGGGATGASATGDGVASSVSDGQGLSAGAIASIVVGVVVLVAGFAALLAWMHISRQHQHPPRATASSSGSMASAG
jgi:hypothetical protein